MVGECVAIDVVVRWNDGKQQNARGVTAAVLAVGASLGLQGINESVCSGQCVCRDLVRPNGIALVGRYALHKDFTRRLSIERMVLPCVILGIGICEPLTDGVRIGIIAIVVRRTNIDIVNDTTITTAGLQDGGEHHRIEGIPAEFEHIVFAVHKAVLAFGYADKSIYFRRIGSFEVNFEGSCGVTTELR